MIKTATNMSDIITEADRLYGLDWECDPELARDSITEEHDPYGWTRTINRETETVTIRDADGETRFSMSVDHSVIPEFLSIGFTATIPAGKHQETRIDDSINIGTGAICGKLSDIPEFEARLKKTVKALKKAGAGYLDIDYAVYGREWYGHGADRHSRLVQMRWDEWQASMDGDITEEGVYLRPVGKYTNWSRDKFLTVGSLAELDF